MKGWWTSTSEKDHSEKRRTRWVWYPGTSRWKCSRMVFCVKNAYRSSKIMTDIDAWSKRSLVTWVECWEWKTAWNVWKKEMEAVSRENSSREFCWRERNEAEIGGKWSQVRFFGAFWFSMGEKNSICLCCFECPSMIPYDGGEKGRVAGVVVFSR